jgi:toxin ParE1/3/4
MATVVFRKRAETDLRTIGEYTLRTWGLAQAEAYVLSIKECCQLLAERPRLGRACDLISPGLRRMEHAEHIIFYRVLENTIIVSRILHRSMLPERHPMQD